MEPGARLGPYEIVERIGAGGMGEVWRARDTRLDREVAIKVLPDEFFEDKERRERFRREAKLLAAVNHPGIAAIHSFEEISGRHLLVQELVEGETLAERLAGGALSTEEVLRVGHQLADALAHAHERGVVHRDFKSANVILSPDGQAKVLDFGLAKKLSPKEADEATTLSQVTLTEAGTVAGTPAYMAPEQFRGLPADERSDVWALGVVLYEMVAGRRPFRGHTGFEVSSEILTRPPQPLPPSVPGPLRAVIERCLAKEPSQRYRRGSEVRAALEVVRPGPDAPRGSPSRAARRKGTAIRKRIRSLVVLPLANLSGDSGQEYFADGMTEALISYLAGIRALRVISRTSAMRYKATGKALPEIAAELDVDAVVEGTVLSAGKRVRIAARLVHAATDTHVWSGSYERDLKDVLFLQSEVARAIASEIRVAVTPEEVRRLASARPVDPEAYEAYLKGRHLYFRLSPEHFDRAEGYFRIAIEKDPDSALAWAGIASIWAARTDTGFVSPEEAIPKAKAAAARALERDEGLADVHIMLGNLRFCGDWDWSGAESAFRRGLQLNPNSAEGRFFYSDLLISTGRASEAMAEMKRALELDPLSFFFHCFYGWHLVYLRRPDDAVVQLEKTLRMEPEFASAHLGLWGAHYTKGDLDGARAAALRFFRALGDREVADALSPTSSAAGYADAMRLAARTLEERSSRTHVPGFRIARLFAHAGETEKALGWLDKAFERRESPLVHLHVGWDWDGVRGDPRFRSLLRRMNLPES
jgi:serine/threonine-protein kinase